MRLEGKVAIVTGAGSGIGRATALRLAAEGAVVAAADVRLELAAGTTQEIEKRGGKSTAHAVNVAVGREVEATVAAVLSAHGGRIDILINNAGIARDATAKKLSEEDWDTVLDVNLKGTFLFCQKVIPAMVAQNYGRIVNTASIAMLGNFGQANYAASKAGVVGLTCTLALELARHSVTVNCISPGATDTAMVANIPEPHRKELIARIPLKRLGLPEDIAALHSFLASDEASYITGQVIFCDGGLSVGS